MYRLPDDPSYTVWPLPYFGIRREVTTDGEESIPPNIDKRTLYRIRLHCEFANPGSYTSVMYLTEDDRERLHIAIQNPSTDVTDLIAKLIAPELLFPYSWYPFYHVDHLPPFYTRQTIPCKYLKKEGKIVYIDLDSISEIVNYSHVYEEWQVKFIDFFQLANERGLVQCPQNDNFCERWRLRTVTPQLFPEAVEFLDNWIDLAVPTRVLTSVFLLDRRDHLPFYVTCGSSPILIHSFALHYENSWFINGKLQVPMESMDDYQAYINATLEMAAIEGTVYRKPITTTIPPYKGEAISEVTYKEGPHAKQYRSLLFPPNQVPLELF